MKRANLALGLKGNVEFKLYCTHLFGFFVVRITKLDLVNIPQSSKDDAAK